MTQSNENIPGNSHKKLIIAIVGMPGAGKSEVTNYLEKKGMPSVRFGDITDLGVKELGIDLTPENEKVFREKLRKELGMEAYAVKSEAKIEKLLENNNVVVINGLYSWEEYIYLKNKFPNLVLIHVCAEPEIRYKRLANRSVRPLNFEESRGRDIAEIEGLSKGGPIAIADYMIENNSDNINDLYQKLDNLLKRLGI
ncbi:MAG: AAA family ATPase [Patescibacteria group bacterium]|nr:AAA family ATPase [Patescibacteria group bacterium]